MTGAVILLALCDQHSMVLKQDVSVWGAGFNQYGQLGDSSTVSSFKFVCTVTSGAKAVTADSDHSMVLKQDGSVWAAGQNEHGQLGRRVDVGQQQFYQGYVERLSHFGGGSLCRYHNMVMKQDDSVWDTDKNNHDQFGDGTTATSSSSRFVRVVFDSVQTIASW